MEMSTKYDIEKYDGKTSFALWQVRMAAILSCLGIKNAIYGREELGEAISDKKWHDMDDKALSTIQLCLSNATLQEVLSEKTAKDLWEKLEGIYLKKSITNRLRLKLRLYTLCMDEGTSLSDHIAEFTSILNDLGKLGIKVEEEDQALLLLCSLPASYKSFRDMMVYSREKITLDDVKSNLQAKLHLDGEMTNVEKESQGVGLVMDRGRSNTSSSAPYVFGTGTPANSAASSTSVLFGSSTNATSGLPFAFGSPATTTPLQPVFSNPSSFGIGSSPAAALFGQQPMPNPSSSFTYGSGTPAMNPFGSTAPGGASPFQFGGQPSMAAQPNPSPFQASGSLEFAGGSFYLGASGGGDKSARNIVRVKRRQRRK